MLNRFKKFFSDEQGQGAAEYGLILALVVVAVIAAMAIFSPQLSAMFTDIGDKLTGIIT